MRDRLDAIDWQILTELQADGRMTNVELARRVGVSAPPCLRRVRILEEAGIIEGYRGLLNPKKLGFDVQAFAFVQLVNNADSDMRKFQARIGTWPAVRECFTLSGDVDFLLKCTFADLSGFQAFMQDLTTAANVKSVKTSLVHDRVKNLPLLPIGPECAPEDHPARHATKRTLTTS